MVQKVTHQEIKEEIVNILQKQKVFFKGKIITSVKDLPKRYTMPSYVNTRGERVKNKYWRKAYANIANSRRPKKSAVVVAPVTTTATPTQAFVAPRQERVHTNNNTISITLPSGMSATALIDLIAIIKKSGAKCSL